MRNRDTQIGYGEPVLTRYERVCFDKEFCNVQGLTPAALICPDHPLLDATLDLVRERSMDVMKRGAVFIDDSDYSTSARLLFYIEDAIQDGMIFEGWKQTNDFQTRPLCGAGRARNGNRRRIRALS